MADATNPVKAGSHKLIGQNYTTPDLVAKVTGKAKYAEDFRAEGMLFCKLLLSPMPHARVTKIDASATLAMPGVKGILTEEDFPKVQAGAELGENLRASAITERGLTNEPMYEGEPLSFSVDPIASLRPGSSNARTTGNVWARPTPPPAAPGAAGRGAQAPPPPRPE